MNVKTTLLAAAATIALSASAFAAPLLAVGSQLNLTGFDNIQPDNSATNGTSPAANSTPATSATGLDFTAGTTPNPGTPGVIDGANGTSGSFTSFGTCTANCGTIQDILSFAAFNASAGNSPEFTTNINGNVISFNLYPVLSTSTTGGALVINGNGTVFAQGFAPTAAMLTLSTQGNGRTSYSLTVTSLGQSVPVPEPISLALLGTSLAGLGLVRRFRARR